MIKTSVSQDATSRIRRFVMRTFPLARKRDVGDTTDLLNSGIIDSLGVLDLVAFLQQEFVVVVDEGDFIPENFKSIECMVKFVERMLEPPARSIQSV